jgi:hypothetical protein
MAATTDLTGRDNGFRKNKGAARRKPGTGKRRPTNPVRLLAVISASAMLFGCTHLALDPNYRGPAPLPLDIREDFSYPSVTDPVSKRILKRADDYTLWRITFPSSYNLLSLKNDITIDYYDIRPQGRAPVVMVLPILGGGNGVAEIFARHFAANGYAAVLVHRQKEYKRINDLTALDPTLKQIVIDHRQAIDWIETRPELDADRIAVFGVSMGGIKGALLSAVEKRIKASVLVLVGGDIPYILTYSEENDIIKRRRAIMHEEGLSPEEFYRRLSKMITADPLRLAPYIDARKTLLILSRFDAIVPYITGEELRHRIGNPETIYLTAGHYTAVLYTSFVKYQATHFLKRQIGNHQTSTPPPTRQAQLTEEEKQSAVEKGSDSPDPISPLPESLD